MNRRDAVRMAMKWAAGLAAGSLGAIVGRANSGPRERALASTNDSKKTETQLTVMARLTPKEEKVEDVRKRLLSNVPRARAEKGCVSYDVHESLENPGQFMLYENWASQAALDAHFEMPYMKQWVAERDQLVEKREFTRWNLLS
jgi:quinol monooxygenase YgiN